MYHNSQILSSTKYFMIFRLNRNIKKFTELKILTLIEGLCNYVCWDISELNIYIYESACNAGDTSLIPGSERSLGGGNACISSVQFSSSARLPFPSPTPRVNIHRVGDAIQPFHPLSFPSPAAINLSQHQDIFQWVCSLHQVAKVLEFQLQHQSFQWIFRLDFL